MNCDPGKRHIAVSILEHFAPLLIVTALALARPSLAQDLAWGVARAGALCHPLSWDAVVPGITTDDHVKRLYGNGVFSPEGGHTGTRYYVDTKHTVTVEFELGVDFIVETITISAGLHLPKGMSPRRAESRFIDNRQEFFGLTFGASEQQVRRALGEPRQSDPTLGTLTYPTDYAPTECLAAEEAVFSFSSSRLRAVSLHSGD